MTKGSCGCAPYLEDDNSDDSVKYINVTLDLSLLRVHVIMCVQEII